MIHVRNIFLLLILVFTSIPVYAQVWTEFASMKVRGKDVTLFGDRTSFRVDDDDDEHRRLWVKLELSDDIESGYNDKKYRVRKEEYFFDCEEKKFAVSHTILLDKDGNEVYDSGYHHPFDPEYGDNWFSINGSRGPEIIHDKVCNLNLPENSDQETNPGKEKSEAGMKHDNGFRKSGSITGGIITDGLDVKKVRWASRDGFERLVFDVYKWGGYDGGESTERVDVPGYFEISGTGNSNTLDIKLEGYRAFSAKMPDFKESKLIKSLEVNRDEKFASDSGFFLELDLMEPPVFKAYELRDPARIVIDLKN